jgi:hypothetical protein
MNSVVLSIDMVSLYYLFHTIAYTNLQMYDIHYLANTYLLIVIDIIYNDCTYIYICIIHIYIYYLHYAVSLFTICTSTRYYVHYLTTI